MTAKELQVINFLHWLNNPLVAFMVAVLAIWIIIWNGTALWKAARNDQSAWFVVMLLVNTIGILEIMYIFFFSKKKENKPIA